MKHFLFAAVVAMQAAPLAAQTEADLEWVRYPYTSFEPSEAGLAIAYGLPESDLVVMRGICLIGDGQTSILGSFSAILGAAVNGQPVLLEFDGLTGGLPVVTARAIGVGAELGITGGSVELPTNDRLWTHLAQAETLRYRIRGQEDWAEYPGAPDLFASFQSDCAAQAAFAGATGAESTPDANATLTCSEEEVAISGQLGSETEIVIRNDSGVDRLVYWMDETGIRVEMGGLPAGQSATLGTRDSHYWLIADSAGACVSIHTGSSDITLPAPARVDSK